MGDNDLEERASSIPKTGLKVLKQVGFAAGIGSALGILGVYALDGELPNLERLKESACSWSTYRNTIMAFLAADGCFSGAYLISNSRRIKKGKKPRQWLQYIKWALGRELSGRKPEEKDFLKYVELLPDTTLSQFELARHYMKENKLVEALEAYCGALRCMDEGVIPKIPLIGPFEHVGFVSRGKRALKKRLEKNPDDSKSWLELAIRNLLVYDFENATGCLEKIDKEQDPVALHILASRFYSEISKRADRPKMRRLFSFGDSRVGRAIDRIIYFWEKRPDKDEMTKKAEGEAVSAVEEAFKREDIQEHLEPFGDYEVYRIALNSLAKGFVVLKKGDRARLQSELEHERIFEEKVAGGRFKSVHPIGIVDHEGSSYLVLYYEDGKPLAESKNPEHFRSAMEFAAKSDALMPTDNVHDRRYRPREHFLKERIKNLDDSLQYLIWQNSGFLFKYDNAFPVVFDGDWHPFNCLFDEDGFVIGLDKEGKGVTIGPVTAARIANQGTNLGMHPRMADEMKDSLVEDVYIPAYQDFASKDRRIGNPELFLPHMMAKVMEKAITSYIFNAGRPTMQEPVRVFLRNALHAGQRIRYEFRLFYSPEAREQCRNIEEAIQTHFLS